VTKARIAAIVLVAAVAFGQQTSAQTQSLPLSLLTRYYDSLREQAGIPGLTGIVLQNGTAVWRYQSGKADVEANSPATTDTPYYITGLSQVLSSTLLLRRCVDQSYLEVTDPVVRWDPAFAEPATTVRDLLTHTAPNGGYRFDLTRFAELSPVINQCTSAPYQRALSTTVFGQLGMMSSVPYASLATPTLDDQRQFDASTLQRFASVVRSVAPAYRVAGGRATRSDFSGTSLDRAIGVISSVEDLARFDSALRDKFLLADTLTAAWSRSGTTPLGLGWFVQGYNNQPVVWQFGVAKDAYSGLILKLPNRELTLILLANSDGLSAPFALENGDVTKSIFAKTFLTLVTGS
jgi:CubicO group peptidase (beta-lactamase class C family)